MLGTWFSVVWFSPAGVEGCGPVASGRSQAEWTEREILLRFYAVTGGPEGMWEDASNWGSARPLEEWYGVFVDGDGKVDSLILADNGLAGTVPGNLDRLTALTTLDLMDNRLTGTIPAELGSLAHLEFLDLGRNRLTGAIPSELANLTRLRVLYLNHNRLTGRVPEGLGALPELEFLRLGHNRLQVPSPDPWPHILHGEFQPQQAGEDT